MGDLLWRKIASRIRNRILRRATSKGFSLESSKGGEQSAKEIRSGETNANKDPMWFKKTNFRSALSLRGSPIIKIWFESVDEIGVRFSLNLRDGTLSERENWEPGVQMPGGELNDPEPLSVWGISSLDGHINIIMHVDAFDSLYIDGEMADKDDDEEVMALLTEITNVMVRDLWQTGESS